MEKNSVEGLIQVAELAHDYGLPTDKPLEKAYQKAIKRRSKKNKKARERYRRPAYEGTAAETGRITR